MGTIRTRILKGFFISRTLAAADVAMGTIRTRILKANVKVQSAASLRGRNGHDPHEDTESHDVRCTPVTVPGVAMGTIRTRILKDIKSLEVGDKLSRGRNGHDPHEDTESLL